MVKVLQKKRPVFNYNKKEKWDLFIFYCRQRGKVCVPAGLNQDAVSHVSDRTVMYQVYFSSILLQLRNYQRCPELILRVGIRADLGMFQCQ